MTRNHSLAQQFAGIRWGLSLVALAGIASTVELAAMPLPAMDAELADRSGALLGHLSGGIGRDGREFLSVYTEVRPLPADD